LRGIGFADPAAVLLEREEEARRLASWTSVNKHTDLMRARAWFLRGLAALIVAGLVAGIGRASVEESKAGVPSKPIGIQRPSTTTSTL
jgi:hypothetical protein